MGFFWVFIVLFFLVYVWIFINMKESSLVTILQYVQIQNHSVVPETNVVCQLYLIWEKSEKNISSPFILADCFAVCRELSHISSFEITTTCQETYYYYTHFTVNETIRSILYPRFHILTVPKYRFQVRDYLHQSQHKLAALSSPEFLWFMVLPHY